MVENEIGLLVYKYKSDSLSKQEEKHLNSWINISVKNKELFDELINDNNIKIELQDYHPKNKVIAQKVIWDKIQEQIRQSKSTSIVEKRMYRRIFAVAAFVVVFLGLSVFFLTHQKLESKLPINVSDVKAPANNRATITLANGQKVTLDSVLSGTIALQANYKLISQKNGQLIYQFSGEKTDEKIIYNTIENPRGSKVVDLVLSDGTKIWLNAGSSITFPVSFLSKERIISFRGEAYFEVAHDESKPFIVNTGKIKVQVLGTGFNINAYEDDDENKVTLLTGSIKLSTANNHALLLVGEQAIIKESITIRPDMDINRVMAWKNNKFIFKDDSIFEIMKQLERWYNIQVEYTGSVTNDVFIGNISRDVNLSQILDLLSETKVVRFEIKGKKVIVQNQNNTQ